MATHSSIPTWRNPGMEEPHFLHCFGFIVQVGLFLLSFPAQRSSFSICCKDDLVVLNSLKFCLSGKLLISPSNLEESLAGQSIFGCKFFPFIILNISCYSLLACRVSVEKSANNLMGILLYVVIFPLLLLIFYICL